MVVVNVLFLLVGLALVGGGAYLFTNFESFEALLSEAVVQWGIVAGGILMVLAILAIYGAVVNNKKVIIFYLICMVVLLIGQLVIVAVALNYTGELESLNGNKTNEVIDNFLLRSYDQCCFQVEENCNTQAQECQRVLGCDDPICNLIETCRSGVCITGVESGPFEPVDIAVCSALEAIDIVGPADNSTACGGGGS